MRLRRHLAEQTLNVIHHNLLLSVSAKVRKDMRKNFKIIIGTLDEIKSEMCNFSKSMLFCSFLDTLSCKY